MESANPPLSTRIRKMRKHSHRYHFVTELDSPMSAQKQYAPCHTLSTPLQGPGGILRLCSVLANVLWETLLSRSRYQSCNSVFRSTPNARKAFVRRHCCKTRLLPSVINECEESIRSMCCTRKSLCMLVNSIVRASRGAKESLDI